jgi:hypothetical protein
VKPRFLFLPIATAVAVVILFAAVGAKSDDPPPEPQVVTVDATVQGKTAAQWHAVAVRYRQSVRTVIHSRPTWGSWLERAFLCIHSHEGSWTDPRPPFYGGVQMNLRFQRTYGDWALKAFGTADHWPISVQLAVAIRAKVSGRGFGPWPNTARYCGLI